MNKVAVVLACLACVGHGHQVQTSPRSKALAQLLLASNPEDAFKPSTPGGLNRRDLIARAGAGLAALSAAQAATAKSGDFGTLNFFSATGQATLSDPYQPSGTKGGKNAEQGTGYGVGAGEGKVILKGYKADYKEEKMYFGRAEAKFLACQPNVDAGIWYLVGDDLREEAGKLRKSMKIITSVTNTKAATKGYDKFILAFEQLNDAAKLKKDAIAKQKYEEAKVALTEWKGIVGL